MKLCCVLFNAKDPVDCVGVCTKKKKKRVDVIFEGGFGQKMEKKNFFCDLNGKTGVYVLQNEWGESSFKFYGIYTTKKTNPVFFFFLLCSR